MKNIYYTEINIIIMIFILYSMIFPIDRSDTDSIFLLPVINKSDASTAWELPDYFFKNIEQLLKKRNIFVGKQDTQKTLKGISIEKLLYHNFKTKYNILIIIKDFDIKNIGASSYGFGGSHYTKFKMSSEINVYDNVSKQKQIAVAQTENNTNQYGFFLKHGLDPGMSPSEYIKSLWRHHYTSEFFQKSFLNKNLIAHINNIIVEIFNLLFNRPIGLRLEIIDVRDNKLYMKTKDKMNIFVGQEFYIIPNYSADMWGDDLDSDTYVGIGKITKYTNNRFVIGTVLEKTVEIKPKDIIEIK